MQHATIPRPGTWDRFRTVTNLLDHQRGHIELETIILGYIREIEHDLMQRVGTRVAARSKIDVPRRSERMFRGQGSKQLRTLEHVAASVARPR